MKSSTTALLKEAVHRNRRVSRQGVLERMFTVWFRGLVYNQIWEDPRVDAQAMDLGPGHRVLTISSGGCNVLNYLVHRPERIIAIDLNTCHMSLTRLKLAALKHLPDYEAFFNFFGVGHHADNLSNYRTYIREHLDPVTRRYWETSVWPGRHIGPKRIGFFRKGFYNYSKLGLLFRIAHRLAKVTRRNPNKLLEAKSMEEQEKAFQEIVDPLFDNRFIRWFSRSPMTVFSLGIPPSQYKVMKEESGGRMIDLYRERMRRLTCGFPLEDNYFAWQAFGRRYDLDKRQALPDYLREENYELLRENLDRVETHIMTLGQFLDAQPDASLDRYVLLDSQDWMPPEVITDLWTKIERTARPGGRVIFRTAGENSPVEAALPADLREKFIYHRQRSEAFHKQDRSAIYGMFHLYELADGAVLGEDAPAEASAETASAGA